MPATEKTPQQHRLDTWQILRNCSTGLGIPGTDWSLDTTRPWHGYPTVEELERERYASWMADREVGKLAADMFRAGFDLRNVQPAETDLSQVHRILEGGEQVNADGVLVAGLGLIYYAQRTIDIGDMVGGAALLAIVEDGVDPREPLRPAQVKSVRGWEVLDRDELVPLATGTAIEPQYYMLSSIMDSDTVRPGQVIHRSRLWLNRGVEMTRREMRYRNWWGMSVLEKNWQWRRGAEAALGYLLSYAHRASWLHFQVAEMSEIASDQGGEEILQTRLATLRNQAVTFGVIMTDAGKDGTKTIEGTTLAGRPPDKVESIGETVGDLPLIEQTAREWWRMGAEIPASIAFGESPTGLRGGANEGDWQAWEGVVQAQQRARAVPLLNWMLTIVFSAQDGPTGGLLPTWTLEARQLRVPTNEERIKEQNLVADGDSRRIIDGVVSSGEVREQRVVLQDFGPLREMKLPPTETKQQLRVGDIDAFVQLAKGAAIGEVTPASAAWIVSEMGVPPERATAFAEAARPSAPAAPAAPPSVAPASPSVAVEAAPTVDAAGQLSLPMEPDADDGLDFTRDPVPPGGIRKAREIAAEFAARGVPLTVRRIRALARPGKDGSPPKIRAWDVMGPEPAYSPAEVLRVWRERNGGGNEPAAEGVEQV